MSEFLIKNAVRVEDGVATMNIKPKKAGDWNLVHVYSPENAKLEKTTGNINQMLVWMEHTFQGDHIISPDMMEENMQLAYKIYNSDQKDNFIKILKDLIK